MRFRACIAISAVTIITAALCSQSKSDAEFHPKIPKAWDDADVATMELPLAAPAPRAKNISEKYYYSIPAVTIYKSYPLLSPDKPFHEYLEWLKQQAPEDAFDPAKLKTKTDWEEAGKLVFSFTLGRYETLQPQVVDFVAQGKIPADVAASVRIYIREKGKLEQNGNGWLGNELACVFCHSQTGADSKRIDGVQPNTPGIYPSPGIAGANVDQKRQAMLFWYGTPWLSPDPNVNVNLSKKDVDPWNKSPAVDDREGSSFSSPLQIPVLIGLKDRKYFDHTGLHQHRSIGDLMRYAVLASDKEILRQYGDFIPGGSNSDQDLPEPGAAPTPASFGQLFTADHKNLPPPSKLLRFTDEQLYALALYIYSLDYPENPNRPDALSAKGETIFKREGCAGCHTPPLYTNNKLIPVDGFVVPPADKKKYDIMDVRIGLDPYLATKTRRGTGYYKVPSLRGVWMRSALEHNGSVASLEDWFDPNRLRDTYVPTGFRGPSPTRAVKGHPFGLKLSVDDEKALLAFLRTL